jgi:hypothetical protein
MSTLLAVHLVALREGGEAELEAELLCLVELHIETVGMEIKVL